MAMISRRSLLEGGPAAILGAFFAQSVAQGAPGPLFVQDLPKVSLDGWTVTASEVDYEPGGVSKPHRHPGFVLGYVLEGEVRFQLKGGQERICKTGEMFYEPPGSVHLVSANASSTNKARLLAMVFAEKGQMLSMPA